MEASTIIGIGISCTAALIALGTVLYKLGYAIATSRTTQKFYEHNVPKLWVANSELLEKLHNLETDFEVYKVKRDRGE